MSYVDDHWLGRIDGHLERGNELMNRLDETLDRLEARLDDDRTFMRELILRVEKGGGDLVSELRSQHQDVMRELRAYSRAFLALLDRLPPKDNSSTA